MLDELFYLQILSKDNRAIYPTQKEFHLYDYLHLKDMKKEVLRR